MIPYEYLLGRPWSRMNCAEAVRTALNAWLATTGDDRHVSRGDLPGCPEDAQEALSQLREDRATAWAFRCFDATQAREGDIIVSESPRGPHVSLAVGGGVALSSSQERGVHAVGLQFLSGVRGVYRLR